MIPFKLQKILIFLKEHGGVTIFLIFLLSYLTIADRIFAVPNQFEIFVDWIRSFYQNYGYLTVIVAGLIEGLLIVNWYFPGSSAILLGAVFAGEGIISLPLVIIFGILSLSTGSVINYFVGKHGWYKLLVKWGFQKTLEKAEKGIKKHGIWKLFWWYMHPQFGVFVSTAAGILKYPFWQFLTFTIVAYGFSGTFWGIIAFLAGPQILQVLNNFFFPAVITLIIIWLIIKVIQKLKNKKQNIFKSLDLENKSWLS